MTQEQILVLDKNWTPHSWIGLEKAIAHEATNEVVDHLGEAIFVYHGGKNRFTDMQSMIETSSIIVVDGAPNARHYKEPALTNPSLFQRDRHLCAYCGRVYRSLDLTRDHVIPQNPENPKVAKGKDVWMNVVTACKTCNSLKGNMLPGERISAKSSGYPGPQGDGHMTPLYLPYIPCKAEHMIMKGRNIKADQMAFLISQITNPNSRVLHA